MAQKWKEVGALWERDGSFSGTIDLGVGGEVSIQVYKNDKKEDGSNQPDFRVVIPTGKTAEAAESDE